MMLEVVLTNLKISEPEVLDEMLLFKFHIQTIEKSYIYTHRIHKGLSTNNFCDA